MPAAAMNCSTLCNRPRMTPALHGLVRTSASPFPQLLGQPGAAAGHGEPLVQNIAQNGLVATVGSELGERKLQWSGVVANPTSHLGCEIVNLCFPQIVVDLVLSY